MEKLTILEQIAPFNRLDQNVLMQVRNMLVEKDYPKGSFFFKQGDPSVKTLFILTEGIAEVTGRNEKGVEAVIDVRKPYDYFGETTILTDKRYPASVKAVTDCKALLLDRETFDYLIENTTEFSNFFSVLLADRLRGLFKQVVQEHTYEAYGTDAQPFRKRICDVMTSPVVTCRTSDTVTQAAKTLSEKGISSLVVVDDSEFPVGIVTQTDLVSRILAVQVDNCLKDLPVSEIMSANPLTMSPDAYYYQALLAMVKNKIKQIPVIERNKVIGIITLRDLLQSRSTGSISIVDNIESENTITGLQKASKGIDNVLKALIAEKASAQELGEVITELFDRLTRKIIKICEQEMFVDGFGRPPVDYCWITMGSSGRKEQITRTDQDNGIIYDDSDPTKLDESARYFAVLGEKVVDGLHQCGFALCKGKVMATNPLWRKPFQEWTSSVAFWVREPHSEMLRNFTIFLDFRPVYGNPELAERLRNRVIEMIQDNPMVLYFLAKDDLAQRVPLGIFKQFVTLKSKEHRGEINLKLSALIHIVDCIRIFSIQEGILATNTFDRIKALTDKGIFSRDDSEFTEAAYETLMTFRNRENLRKISLAMEPDNHINPHKLSKREQAVLKESFMAINRLQNHTGSYFRIEGF